MSKIETLDVLPGEGEISTVTYRRERECCDNCGEPAHFKHNFLLPNARRNPASSAYGGDDITWCSDYSLFTCRECKKPNPDGYSWCATFPAVTSYANMFLRSKSIEDRP